MRFYTFTNFIEFSKPNYLQDKQANKQNNLLLVYNFIAIKYMK